MVGGLKDAVAFLGISMLHQLKTYFDSLQQSKPQEIFYQTPAEKSSAFKAKLENIYSNDRVEKKDSYDFDEWLQDGRKDDSDEIPASLLELGREIERELSLFIDWCNLT